MRPRPPGTLPRWAVATPFESAAAPLLFGELQPWGPWSLGLRASGTLPLCPLADLGPDPLPNKPAGTTPRNGRHLRGFQLSSAPSRPVLGRVPPSPISAQAHPFPVGGIPISGSVTPRVAFRGPDWRLSLSSRPNVLRAEGQESRGARPGPVFLFAAPIPSLQGLESSLQSPQITGPSFSGWGRRSLIRGSGSPWWNVGRNREPEAVLPLPHPRPTLAGAREDCSQS